MVHNDLFHHVFFYFATADLKKFTWCNVIQQIKKVSPNTFKQSLKCAYLCRRLFAQMWPQSAWEITLLTTQLD